MTLIITILAIVAMFVLVMGLVNLSQGKRRDERERVARRLGTLRRTRGELQDVDLERHRALSDMPWLHRLLAAQSWTAHMDLILEQGQVKTKLGVLMLTSVVAGSLCLMVMVLLFSNVFLITVPPLAVAYVPFMLVLRKRDRRMAKFQRQLPDALDLVGRALRAGHAFNQGMRMVADEFADPMGPEFQKMLDEINFGVPADTALLNLTRRVDCPDLKFFVVSVNIQRETGGNLAEIVTSIARLIRERFKLAGRVRVLSAEGRLTAWILLALPFAIGIIINFLNPDFMSVLYETPEGNFLLTGSLFQMTIGAIALKRMTTIKV